MCILENLAVNGPFAQVVDKANEIELVVYYLNNGNDSDKDDTESDEEDRLNWNSKNPKLFLSGANGKGKYSMKEMQIIFLVLTCNLVLLVRIDRRLQIIFWHGIYGLSL